MRDPVRPPLQERSRAGWERALDTASALFEQGGYEALSVTEVCRRAGISAPSLYARVDGKDGLFRAVYARGMAAAAASEAELLPASPTTVEEVVGAITEVFARHEGFLKPVIRHAAVDPILYEAGAQYSRALVERLAALLPGSREAAAAAARLLYAECTFRTMYGPTFWDPAGESGAAFRAHLTEACRRMLRD
ncbi:TetR/AcrR family transcriptional regulator [Leucobacter allii]|uniref:TetR/AcrR family transcriptional regulator n=1 Tax=Leucobacter allii TaxID=2932247 RepID=A0ABY4FMC0_9MICO|nr:TetR/AcrR family transcriptional regulator [Leucobacter allii]UOQ57425.1 TetR/AcrR family transcriptional regulator [Leucobacter allii]